MPVENLQIVALGALGAYAGASEIGLGGRKQRALLGRLIVAYPGGVQADQIVEAVWPGSTPRAYASSLQAYISRLRGLLGEHTIAKEAGGYRLDLNFHQADWLGFLDAVDLADRAEAAHRHAEVISILEPALMLWRGGQVLGDLGLEPWAEGFELSLRTARRRAACRLAASQLRVGAFDKVFSALAAVDFDPYDEEPVEVAMRAHYAAGRQQDALSAFHQLRSRLARDIGIDPSPRLVSLHQGVLQQRPELAWKPPDRSATPRLLPPPLHRLIGRDEEIQRIEDLLSSERRVVLYGLAGSGKSSLAAGIAHRSSGAVCWISAEDEASALTAVTELALRLGLPRGLARDDLLRNVWDRLDELPEWMLVLDNVGPPDLGLWLFPPETSRGKVLATSLDPSWVSAAEAVKVAPLNVDDATALLLAHRGNQPGSRAEVEQDATDLAMELGGLPLALEQAAVYMMQTGMSMGRYLELFQTRQGQLLSRGAPPTHPSPAGTTWSLLFEAVRQRSAAAAEMLELASFLSPDGVPWTLLTSGDDSNDENELRRLDAVIQLTQYSLVDRDDAELRVHRLVQAVVRSKLSEDERRLRAAQATTILCAALPPEPGDPSTWPLWSSLLPQVDALLRAAQATHVVPADLVGLICRCAAYLRYRSALLLADSMLDQAIALFGHNRADPRALAILFAQRSEIRDDLGELEPAREDIMKAVALAGPRRLDAGIESARTWARLAHVLNCADEREEAVELYTRAIAIFVEAKAAEELAGALIGLSYTRWGQDDYTMAVAHSREALQVVDRAGWRQHPLHPAALSALGMMLHETGRCQEARELQLAALSELDAIYGGMDHHDKAYTLDKLGYEERLLGNHAAALAAHQHAVEMLTRLFGARDPRLAIVVSNRGLDEEALGDLLAATHSQEHALALLMTAFSPRHKLTRLVSERLDQLHNQVKK